MRLAAAFVAVLAAGPAYAGGKPMSAAAGKAQATNIAPAPLPSPVARPSLEFSVAAPSDALPTMTPESLAALAPIPGPTSMVQLSQAAAGAQAQPAAALAASFDGSSDKKIEALVSIPQEDAAALLDVFALDGIVVKRRSYRQGLLALSLKVPAAGVESAWDDLAGSSGKLVSWRVSGRDASRSSEMERVSVNLRLPGDFSQRAAQIVQAAAMSLSWAVGADAFPVSYERTDGSASARYELSTPSDALPAALEAIRAATALPRGLLSRVLRLKERRVPAVLTWLVRRSATADSTPDAVALAEHAAALADRKRSDEDASHAALQLKAAAAAGQSGPELERLLREGLTSSLQVLDAAKERFAKGYAYDFAAAAGYVLSSGEPAFRLRHMIELYGTLITSQPELVNADSKALIMRLAALGEPWMYDADVGRRLQQEVAPKRITQWLATRALGWFEHLEAWGESGLFRVEDVVTLRERVGDMREGGALQDLDRLGETLDAALARRTAASLPRFESFLRRRLMTTLDAMERSRGTPKVPGRALSHRHVVRVRHAAGLYGKLIAAHPDLVGARSKALIMRLLGLDKPWSFYVKDERYQIWDLKEDRYATELSKWLAGEALVWFNLLPGSSQSGLFGLTDALALHRQSRMLFRRSPELAGARDGAQALFIQRAVESSPRVVLPLIATWNAETDAWTPKSEDRELFEALMLASAEYDQARRTPK